MCFVPSADKSELGTLEYLSEHNLTTCTWILSSTLGTLIYLSTDFQNIEKSHQINIKTHKMSALKAQPRI